METIKIYLRIVVVRLQGRMEYRLNFFSDLIVTAITSLVTYAGIWVMFENFTDINGWSYYEVVFLYSLNLIAGGVAGFIFYAPMMEMENMIRNGNFDSMLIRPIKPFMNVICSNFTHTHLVHVLVGVIALVNAGSQIVIQWTIRKILFFIIIALGSWLIQASLMIISGSISFWIIKSSTVVDMMTNPRSGIRRFINFPISIYDKFIQVVLTFVIPFAFINYYPCLYLLDKQAHELNIFYRYATPIIGIVLFIFAYFGVWKNGIKAYQSTGS